MRLIDDDQVVGSRRGPLRRGIVEHTLDHRLHGRDLHPIGGFGKLGRHVCDAEHLVELQEAAGVGRAHRVERLAAQRVAIDEEQDAPEPLTAQHLKHQRDRKTGLARAGRHSEQDVLLARSNRGFNGGDGIGLVGTKAGHTEFAFAQLGCGFGSHLLQALSQVAGAEPFGQCAREKTRRAGIPKPDA